MNLSQAGIALKCRCGATMNAEMFSILFDDRGRVKVNDQPLRCHKCGAIYRRGERLAYQLVRKEVIIRSVARNEGMPGN